MPPAPTTVPSTGPGGVSATTLATRRGLFAALVAAPQRPRGTVVLIPGWTGSKEDFLALLPLLCHAGWLAVGYDQRGQYESGADEHDDFTLDGFAADALAVCATADDGPVHMVGHSFGGLVAQAAALAQPDRLASVTLLCSGPGAITAPDEVESLRLMADAIETTTLAEVFRAKVEHDTIRAAGRAGARSAAPSSAATQPFLRRRFVANHPGSLSAITLLLVTAADRVDELAAIGVPVHVLYGEDDDGWPVDVQREMARRLAVTPHVVPGTAHSPAAEDPHATAALLTRLLAAPPTAAAVPGQHCPADRPG